MADKPAHSHSKSARVLNLIRGSGTAKDSDSESNSPVASTTSVPFPGYSESSTPTSDPNRLQPVSTVKSMESAESITMPSIAEKTAPSGLQTSAMSIEDSVRTFRVFEILRSGDTAAIDKVISEQPPVAGTTVLHLAAQCADTKTAEYVIANARDMDINSVDREGNTPLHLAAQLGRAPIVRQLLERPDIHDAVVNHHGKIPMDLARTPDIHEQLQLFRSMYLDQLTRQVQSLVSQNNYKELETLLTQPRVESVLDVNSPELATDQITVQSGGTLLHQGSRVRDLQLIQLLLMHGADPFRRDRKGQLPQHVTKDERTKSILKSSPAAAVAQRGIQERAILGGGPGHGRSPSSGGTEAGKDAREMKGYLKKWTNYTSGYKLRWFVLEDGVLSYYKHQDDAGSACRGAINMRIATLHMDSQDKTRFEIHGKSSVKYHLKANHVVEAKRWFWSLNNAIQWSKDEAKDAERQSRARDETLRQNKVDAVDNADSLSLTSSRRTPTALGIPPRGSRVSLRSGRSAGGDDSGDGYEPSFAEDELDKTQTNAKTVNIAGEEDMDGDDATDDEGAHHPVSKDAFNITAQSAKLQLDLLARVSNALKAEKSQKPDMTLSDPSVTSALATYENAVSSLNSMVVDLLRISRDRDAYWQYRLDREADTRKMWEDSMAKVAREQEDLQKSIDVSEEKRKRTKRALKEALEDQGSRPGSAGITQERVQFAEGFGQVGRRTSTFGGRRKSMTARQGGRRKSVIAQMTNLSDSESGDDEEFFDAIGTGEVEVVEAPLTSPPTATPDRKAEKEGISSDLDERAQKQRLIEPSYAGYQDGIRKRLTMEADNRPKISLWGILKSMIGKDMTKMTLPVSFNEPTSLLQRVTEDMEYADLLDIAADRPDSTERLVYVAAFAASEYASTIGRVAKPFNPLLGETYEYVRPDKGYRFFIEQVSHHPPIGAAYAESARWDYWGESAVKSKFYGKSFDINPLGTWFLRLRPSGGGQPEIYTWKKVTSSVIGIITGNPTVDNYGPMEIKNWTTGDICTLDFKPKGWKASSAFQVTGKVVGRDGVTRWSIGGRWNDKIYARRTPGFEDDLTNQSDKGLGGNANSEKAFLVWSANPRPTGIPFNLTPFVVTLNAIPDNLRAVLPPTDTRLRPDQRYMEDGEYDQAAVEKNRVEEKQRATRRQRENDGVVYQPEWFGRERDEVTGEEYWMIKGGEEGYWGRRERRNWDGVGDIF